MQDVYQSLCNGGGYTLPTLLCITSVDAAVSIVNDVRPIVYDGKTYLPSNFTYKPSDDGGATLEVETLEAGKPILDILESGEGFTVDAVGIVYDGDVVPLRAYHHKWGSATWDGKSATLKLDGDDRLGMTFPALLFTAYNNRGLSAV